jgi:hypothetical protein
MTLSTGPKIASRPERPISSQPQGQRPHQSLRERAHLVAPIPQQHQRGSRIEEFNTVPDQPSPDLADDLLRGADAIARYIFGTKGSRRQVYYLAETSRLPSSGWAPCFARGDPFSCNGSQNRKAERYHSQHSDGKLRKPIQVVPFAGKGFVIKIQLDIHASHRAAATNILESWD